MKMTRMALSISKYRSNSDDESLATRILMQSGLLYRYSAGIYGKHNLLTLAQENVNAVVRDTLSKYGCVEVSLPLLQPKQIWEQSGRWEDYYGSGQMFTCHMKNGDYCIAPTAEEAMLAFVKNNLRSYKNLPVTTFQIGTKFRNELRSRGGLLRTKEFLMMDAYSFHESEEDMAKEYLRIKQAYCDIFEKLNLRVLPVAALNGDMGGKVSEEFMCISSSGEDTILVNDEGTIGINTEVLEMPNALDYLEENYGIRDISALHTEHCIELGHIFQLGQRYSKAMGCYFKSKNNTDIPYYMGCYGIGLSRVLAAICEENCDEDGLIWPMAISPYKVHIVAHPTKIEAGAKLHDDLLANGVSVIFDDRLDVSIGAKIKDAKLLGTPLLVIIGTRNASQLYELENRADGIKSLSDFSKIVELIKTSST